MNILKEILEIWEEEQVVLEEKDNKINCYCLDEKNGNFLVSIYLKEEESYEI